MDNAKAKILVLVEGAKTDVKLLKHLLSVYGIDQSHQIISYNTNIYSLYNLMFRNTNPDDVDILQLLKEHETVAERKAVFDERYSDILLIFDLDPQDPQFSSTKIMEMMNYFVESSDMGKLYLNYPMVESFYHMKSIPDDDYWSYTATMQELSNHIYKSRVAAENRNHDYSKFAVNKSECNIVIKQNIEKAWKIVNDDTFFKYERILPDPADVLGIQLKKLKEDNSLFVLCTCVFYIPDYNSKLIAE